MNNSDQIIKLAREVLEAEASAILALQEHLDERFTQACALLLNCTGRIIVTGIGKSGHIANKIAATLTSTGSPAFFMHPSEARHGDVGMITPQDVVLMLSKSGHTEELLALLPIIKLLGVKLIALTGNPHSTLAKLADVSLNASVSKEAGPLGLAPTSSTTAALALGDALAIATLVERGFTSEDFARSHPGGLLGKRLLLYVDDVMRSGAEMPLVVAGSSVAASLIEMTAKNLGMTAVVNEQQKLIGVFTDGDLRRVLDKNIDIHVTKIEEVMTHQYKSIQPKTLAAEAINLMEKYNITTLMVVSEQEPCGVIHMHDLLKAGLL